MTTTMFVICATKGLMAFTAADDIQGKIESKVELFELETVCIGQDSSPSLSTPRLS